MYTVVRSIVTGSYCRRFVICVIRKHSPREWVKKWQNYLGIYNRLLKIAELGLLNCWDCHLVYRQMNDEHLALVVDLLHLRPAEMIRFSWALESEDPAVIDAEEKLNALVILQ